MARGLPALWSTLFGGPFLAAGAYALWLQPSLGLLPAGTSIPPTAGGALLAFGGFVVALGLYVQFVAAPEPPSMRENERVVDTRNPAQRAMLAKTMASVPFLAGGIDLLYLTRYPYVYPTVALVVGLYLFGSGLYGYWQNTLTTYIVTNQRVIREYRFVSLVRNEVPVEKVRGVEQRRSVLDSIFGLGDVSVHSGQGRGMTISIESVYDAGEFAETIRDQFASGKG